MTFRRRFRLSRRKETLCFDRLRILSPRLDDPPLEAMSKDKKGDYNKVRYSLSNEARVWIKRVMNKRVAAYVIELNPNQFSSWQAVESFLKIITRSRDLAELRVREYAFNVDMIGSHSNIKMKFDPGRCGSLLRSGRVTAHRKWVYGKLKWDLVKVFNPISRGNTSTYYGSKFRRQYSIYDYYAKHKNDKNRRTRAYGKGRVRLEVLFNHGDPWIQEGISLDELIALKRRPFQNIKLCTIAKELPKDAPNALKIRFNWIKNMIEQDGWATAAARCSRELGHNWKRELHDVLPYFSLREWHTPDELFRERFNDFLAAPIDDLDAQMLIEGEKHKK